MKERFAGLWKRINAQGDAILTFDTLQRVYSQPDRFYHNLNHIRNCLIELDSARNLVESPDLIEFAIWYHDAIYNTRAKDNEEKSAQLAYNTCLQSKISEWFTTQVSELILATKHNSISLSANAKLLVDIDLSILGKGAEEFDEYERNIRREYNWVSEEEFRQGRSQILKMFLTRADQNNLYLTPFFREKYENQAIINLRRSIEKILSHSTENSLPESGIGLFNYITQSEEESHSEEPKLFHDDEESKTPQSPESGIGLFNYRDEK